MAAPTNTFLTTAAIGNREDLTDMIYRITPTFTPLLNLAAKTKATNSIHEWQTQDLAVAADNAQHEGDDAVAKVVTPTVRLSNRTQISSKTVIVSGTQQSQMNPAGRKNEMGYQMAMASFELKRDMEFGLTQNNVASTSPRRSRGLVGWIVDNVDTGAGYVAASYTGNTAQTDGTLAAFTEARFKNVLQKIYTAGGSADTVMLGPAAKQTFSAFLGNSTRFDKGEDQKLYASVEIYVGDFDTVTAVPNRFQRSRDVFILQSDKVAVAYGRPFEQIDLARTGDADKKEIIVEYTLEVRAPKAHGAVYDIL
ncbi:MAG: hypothetical protein RL758_263 [Pseudomonadota bacterium]|jgi:hypothetical protein